MKSKKSIWLGLGVAGAIGTSVFVAASQDYPSYHGAGGRTGVQASNPTVDTPGKAFVRWIDPKLATSLQMDNGAAGTSFVNAGVGAWNAPSDQMASPFVDKNLMEPYRYSRIVACDTNSFWLANGGAAPATYSWNFASGLVGGDEVALYVNIPMGPTDVNPAIGTTELHYPQRYYVYEITGVNNPDGSTNPVREIIDTFRTGGGQVRIGGGGGTTSQVYTVQAAANVTIKLLNVSIRNGSGVTGDTSNASYNLVYADQAEVRKSNGISGSYVAQPIVADLTDTANPFPIRTYGARNEDVTFQKGTQNFSTSQGVITSYNHNGYKVLAAETGLAGTYRRNTVWRWPATGPFGETAAITNQYATDKQNWILGTGGGPYRGEQTVLEDNASYGVAATAGFTLSTSVAGLTGAFKGVDYFSANSAGGGTDRVTYAPRLSDGDYWIDVYTPGGAGLPTKAYVDVMRGPFVVGSTTIDETTTGWHAVKLSDGTEKFSHSGSAPLSFRIWNTNVLAADVGKPVIADQVRFRRTANLSARSTPVFANVQVNDNGSLVQRDVVVVALENGHLYCLDAEGDPATGKTRCYWSYPSELPTGTADPNQVAGLDGPDGIAEMPSAFDTSSATIQHVQVSAGVFKDLLYIGSTNGKVFCLDMTGRGDNAPAQAYYGTTSRRWSWPSDYPSAVSTQNNGPMTGSVAFATVGGNPLVYVPTTIGRFYALDAVGDDTTKVTTINWQYPASANPALPPITMTPTVDFGNVYVAAGSTLYALDQAGTAGVGTVVWNKTGGTQAFLSFGLCSPMTVASTVVRGTMPDTLYVANNNMWVYAINAANGATIWESNELKSSPTGPVSFTYMDTQRPDGSPDLPIPPGRPVVMVPTQNGYYNGLFARTEDSYLSGASTYRMAWSHSVGGTPTPLAHGGRNLAVVDPILDEEHNYMYGASSDGTLWAYSYDPDFPESGQFMTPGGVPTQPNRTGSDSLRNLTDLINRGKVIQLLPEEYSKIVRKVNDGATYADLTAAATASAGITTRWYEYGESLHYMVMDLPDPAFYTPNLDYSIEFQMDTPGASTQRTIVQPRAVSGAPSGGNARVAFVSMTIVGSGGYAMSPGRLNVTARAVAYLGGSQAQAANLSFPTTAYTPNIDPVAGATLGVLNPLGVDLGRDTVGISTDPTAMENQVNGSPNPIARELGQEANDQVGPVAHGKTSISKFNVVDRSLMTLLLGPKNGLSNVRMQTSDLAWFQSVVGPAAIVKPLPTADYPNFEQLPGGPAGVNVSPDYPDIRRSTFTVTKLASGLAQNPLFQPTDLAAPTYTSTDFTNYRTTVAAFNAGMTRLLVPTPFTFEVDVPRYQPATVRNFTTGVDSSIYTGGQLVFVDRNQPGRNGFDAASSTEAFRDFSTNMAIGADERLLVGTPTVDLGSIPGGGGLGPYPWNAGYAIGNPVFGANFFQRFSVFNDGNVNLLNVRAAHEVEANPAASALLSNNGHDASWLDARSNLITDLDPSQIPGWHPATVALQKPRVGDGAPTRLRVNPTRRANAVLGVTDAPLNPAAAQEDPKVAVAPPIGAPTGAFNHNLYIYEDDDASNSLSRLGTVYEPYSDPISLKFTVRETRLTTARDTKSTNMVDSDAAAATGPFFWRNGQPSMLRRGDGSLLVAFASDRAGWNPGQKTEAMTANASQTSIFVSSLAGGAPPALGTNAGDSPLRDLNAFTAAGANWFTNEGTAFPTQAPATLFALAAGETVVPGTLNYGYPTLPTGGVYDPLQAPTDNGHTNTYNPYMAFIGGLTKENATGDKTDVARLFMTQVSGNAGSVNLSAPVALPAEVGTKIGRPSVAQTGSTAYVFYPATASNQTQLYWSIFANGSWRTINSARGAYADTMNLSKAFESVGNPSVVLRTRYSNNGRLASPVMELAFTGKVRGRQSSEVFMARLNLNFAGEPQRNAVAWATRNDQLELDPATELYWTVGADWINDRTAATTSGQAPDLVDINGASILTGTRSYDTAEGLLTSRTILGGTAVINLGTGSIKFDGAIIPKNYRIFAKYQPRFIRVSKGTGANYRSVSMVYDDRFRTDNTASGYYFNSTPNAPLNDRFMLVYHRTNVEGTDAPGLFMRSLKFGIGLPYRPAVDAAGNIISLTVGGPVQSYEVDVANRKIYVPASYEGSAMTVTYTGIDEAGNLIPGLVVNATAGIIGEMSEQRLMPEGGGPNESSPFVALDCLNFPYNGRLLTPGRPGLFWTVWASTRNGAVDLYMGTVAPKFGSKKQN